jgi:hypothetical protein
MAAIATKDLGVNPSTGLANRISITALTIDSRNELITSVYSIETISPTGVVVSSIDNNTFVRRNVAAVIENGVEVTPANLKYSDLEAHVVGQMIRGMLQADLNRIQSLETINEDLKQ